MGGAAFDDMILTVGVPVVGVRYTAEPLLARSIPNLQFDARLVHGYNFVLEMIGEGGGGSRVGAQEPRI